MKKFLSIILLIIICMTSVIFTHPVHADYYAFIYDDPDPDYESAQIVWNGNWRGFTGTPEYDCLIDDVRLYVKIQGSTESEITMNVYEVDGSHLPTGDPIATTHVDHSSLGSSYGYVSWEFDYFRLEADTEYAFMLEPTAASGHGIYWARNTTDAPPVDYYNLSSTNQGSSYSTNTSEVSYHYVMGIYALIPKVITLLPQSYVNNRVELAGYIESMGDDSEVTAGFEYGFTTDYGSTKEFGTITQWDDPKFIVPIYNMPQDVTIHYRAYITGDSIGTVYGDDQSIILSDEGLPHIQTIRAFDITYEGFTAGVLLLDLAEETDMDLSLDYGTTTALGSNVAVATDADEPGNYTVILTGGSEDSVYYYRAKAVGTGGTYYGEVFSVQTLDPNQPTALQKASTWFNSIGFHGEGIWWLIALVIMSISFIVLSIKYGKMGAVGALCISVAVLACLISFSLVDTWLLILLVLSSSIVAGTLALKGAKHD